jgi:hypothetical protein
MGRRARGRRSEITRSPGAGSQAADLRRLERSRPATLQPVDPNRTDTDPDEPIDRCADRGKHPAELALPALSERRSVPGELARSRIEKIGQDADLDLGHPPEVKQGRETLVDLDPRRERTALVAVEVRPQPDRVFPLDPEARVEDSLGPRPVVRQQQQALGILVEPSDRVEPGAVRD